MILSLTELELKKHKMIILAAAVPVYCGGVIATGVNAQPYMPVFCGPNVAAKLRS